MNSEIEQIWSEIKGALRARVDEPVYRIWLEPLEALELTATTLRLRAPSHISGWTEERFGKLLQVCATAAIGREVDLDLQSGSDPIPGGRSSSPSEGRGSDVVRPAVARHNPKLTFDQFVIGDSNRLAHAAALAVAEVPGHAYNPLFICGPPGVGKTHLLHSIGSLIQAHNPGLTIHATSGELFTNEFTVAVGTPRMSSFKDRLRHVDVLLIDDVQFFERKAKTEEEFFHTFNTLHEAGSQIVLTSDRPPQDLQALEDRLRERFQAGLVADISVPELSTRLAILRKRAQCDDIELPDLDVLDIIAARVQTNVRALEGALIRVVAYSSLTGRRLTSELASDVLDHLYPRSAMESSIKPTLTLPTIHTTICAHFNLELDELLSHNRQARVAQPRQVAMYLARELTSHSLPDIGRYFGGRDHTTILHAWRKTKQRLQNEPEFKVAVDKLLATLDRQAHDRRS